MSDERTRQEAAEKLRRQGEAEDLAETVTAYLEAGYVRADIVSAMVESGFDQREASHYVTQVDKARRGEKRANGLGAMGIGAAMLAAGIGITWYTYSAAEGGGTYVVTWGLILFGGLSLISGLYRFLRG